MLSYYKIALDFMHVFISYFYEKVVFIYLQNVTIVAGWL